MNGATKTMDIKILDKELRVACPDEERGELLDAVAYLDKRMREIRDAGKIASVERIALMAALNITHELLAAKTGAGNSKSPGVLPPGAGAGVSFI